MSAEERKEITQEDIIFALDIGTRSIIGLAGILRDDKIEVIAIEQAEHTKRAMIDGQIENIDQVARVAKSVKEKLEAKLGCTLTKVCVATAGRALRTQKAFYELDLPDLQRIDQAAISRLESGAIAAAEAEFHKNGSNESSQQFYLVGYTVSQYLLDNYPISDLKDHHGKNLKAEVIATFLPSEVVESLYTTMNIISLEIASLTLEPIAAINAAIPQNLRLLNLCLVDIGAGTSDIAVSRDGSIVGYTMATIAGDEVTESLMKAFLIDFSTAEHMKYDINEKLKITYTDILGLEHTADSAEVLAVISETSNLLGREIADKILEVNVSAPSAIFLSGGGSKLSGITEVIAKHLEMDANRVAIAGNNFKTSAFSTEYELNNPEYATPLGIAVSAGLSLIHDSCHIILNGKRAKLFRTGSLTAIDVLMMNGYGYHDLIGRSGQNVAIEFDGKRIVTYGERAVPAVLRVNGKDTSITTILYAGDVMEFIPAKDGCETLVSLGDFADPGMEDIITLNGERAFLSTRLKSGDIIMTDEYRSSLPQKEDTDSDDAVSSSSPAAVSEPSDAAAPLSSSLPKQPDETAISSFAPSTPPMATVKMYTFTLNGKKLTLAEKANGLPYYLLDMLEYSDLNFDNPKGEPVLTINGSDASFQQELLPHDVIDIYYK